MLRIEQWKNGVLVSFEEVPDSAEAIKAQLVALDIASVRPLREYLAALPDAPQALKDRENAAVALRAKLAGAV